MAIKTECVCVNL